MKTRRCPAFVCFESGRAHGGVLRVGGGCCGASLCGCRQAGEWSCVSDQRLTGTVGSRRRLSSPSSTMSRLCGTGLLLASLKK